MITYVVEYKRTIDDPSAWSAVPAPYEFSQLDDAAARALRFHAVPCHMPYNWETRIVQVTRKVLP